MRSLRKIYKVAAALALTLGAGQLLAAQPITLFSGQTLAAGQSMVSAFSGKCKLTMQTDGNLVLSMANNSANVLWDSATSGNPGASAKMHDDGTFAIHSAAGRLLWSSHSGHQPNAHYALLLDDFCDLTISDGAGVIQWDNGVTISPPIVLNAGNTLGSGKFIIAPDASYKLQMQTDGDLVLSRFSDHAVIARSNTAGNPGAVLTMQSDGNMVVFSTTGKVLWSTNTGGRPYGNYFLQVLNTPPYLSITSLVGSVSTIWQLH